MALNHFPQEYVDSTKKEVLELLGVVERDGMQDLIKWLETDTDYFSAPASSKGHGGFVGGLCIHSLNVYKILNNLTKNIHNLKQESLIIVGLLHDICKTNFYAVSRKNVKVNGSWHEEEYYNIEDNFPMGHGEKSLFLVERFVHLTDDEAMAIRWHMSGYDDAARQYSGGRAQAAAFERYPLAVATAIADLYATYFMDHKL